MKPAFVLIILTVATAQWLFFASSSAMSKAKFPKKGLRRSELLLIISSVVLAAGFAANIDASSLWQRDTITASASAAATSNAPLASCATVAAGMTTAEVTSRLGQADETRSDEETRGPGTSILVYRGSRCAVHLFEGRVEFVD
jgi:hypothetical protein